MNYPNASPSEQAKELLVEVFKEFANQCEITLTEDQIGKIEKAVDNIMAEVSL